MKVFLTGSTGFIGSALIPELVGAGHTVLGLSRSTEDDNKLQAAGIVSHRGSLEDLDSLRDGAGQCDGVIHCAYNQDISKLEENSRKESQAIAALAEALKGSSRPLLITSVAAMGAPAPGQIAREDFYTPETPNPRKSTEIAGQAAAEIGINVSVVRLPQVHSPAKLGFVGQLLRIAREKGVSAYVGEGHNAWAAVHLSDAARLYRLALEAAQPGARYHAVGEEGIPVRQFAEVIGAGLNLPLKSLSPDEAKAHFGWLAMFAGMDMRASSVLTQSQLHWQPNGPGMIADLQLVAR